MLAASSTTPLTPPATGQRPVRFAAVGVGCTLLYLVVYAALRLELASQVSSLLALLISAMANTALNRRLTFGLAGRAGVREHSQGLLVFALGAALTSGALALLHANDPHPRRLVEIGVLLAASAVATVVRFVLFSRWIFASHRRGPAGDGSTDDAGDGLAAAAFDDDADPDQTPPATTAFGIPSWAASTAVVVLVVAAWMFLLIRTSSPAHDVLGWVMAVTLGILAPGFVVVRLCQRTVGPLIEDLTWAAPAGTLVALLGWFLDRTLPVAIAPWALGPLVVGIALAVPMSRRRVLARPAPGWGAGPTLVLGGTMFVAMAWMAQTGLRGYHAVPGPQGLNYYPDVMYQLDLLGELRHHLVPSYPPVAGASLSYHWFLYAVDAHLTTGTGVASFDSIERLAPATLVPVILMLAAVVARRISGFIWAGPLAAVLLGVIEISEASRWTTEDGSIGILPRVWRSSPPQTMGWFAALAATGAICGFLRRHERDRTVPVLLLVPFLVLCAGSKSSELPVVVAGVAFAGGVALLRRQWTVLRRCAIVGVGGLVVFEAALKTLYGNSSYGVRVQFLGVVLGRMGTLFPPRHRPPGQAQLTVHAYATLSVVTAFVLFVLPLLPRLLGLWFQVRYRPADPAGWMCLGVILAGFALSLITRHPAGSELYFMLSAYPIGVVGAAGGLVLAARRVRVLVTRSALRGWVLPAGLVGLVLLGALAAAGVAFTLPHSAPLATFVAAHPNSVIRSTAPQTGLVSAWLRPWGLYAVVLIVLGVLLFVGLRVLRTRTGTRGVRAPAVLLSLVCLLLGSGLFTMGLQFRGTVGVVQGSRAAVVQPTGDVIRSGTLPTKPDAFAAGLYVQRHSGVDDVVVTNLYCRFDRVSRKYRHRPCDPRNFLASALTERHTLLGGWSYADRILDDKRIPKVSYRALPFWDQPLLDQNYLSFAHPTKALLDLLYTRHHVRWMFLDLRDKPVDVTALDKLAVLHFTGQSIAVWQLRAP